MSTTRPATQPKMASQMSLEEASKAMMATVMNVNVVSQKIRLIDQIASRDGAAAFHATIEASGIHQNGAHAAVMLEVRRLAERSEVAALEIGNLADFSGELADRAGVLLEEMMACIQKATDLLRNTSLGQSSATTSMGPDGPHA